MNSIMQALVVNLFCLIGAGAGFYLNSWQPHEETMVELRSEISKLKSQVDAKDDIVKEIKSLEAEIKKKEAEKERLLKNSPRLESQVPELLKSLEDTAKKFNVKFSDIRISPLIRNEQWSELPVEFTLRGTFHKLGEFLFKYENKKVINLTKGTLSITPTSEMDPKEKKPILTVQLSGTIYALNTTGGGF
ncbi:type 4a pilus biogenesis protein PilO [Candidatus Riflebacteria bacterium]